MRPLFNRRKLIVEMRLMEIEAKFALSDAMAIQSLQTVEQLAGYVLSAPRVMRVRDTYLDTRDRRLLAAGYACRRREQRNEIRITLKQIQRANGAIHRREELEVVLSADAPPAEWQASAARDRVMQIVGDELLTPLFALTQKRRVRQVTQGERYVAAMSVDDVHARAGRKRAAYAELEIELMPDGTDEDLAALVVCLQSEWNLSPESRSKFERALALLDAAATPRRSAKPRLSLNDTMAEAGRKTLLFHFQRMLDHETGTRAGDAIEELHDMRVATRRLRAARRVFVDYLDAPTLQPFAKSLRQAGRALGAVRDLDVFHEKTQHYLDQLPVERRAELDLLMAAWQTEHDRARGELLAFLDDAAYARFKIEWRKLLRTPGTGAAPGIPEEGEPLTYRVRDVLPVVLLGGLAAVRAFDATFEKKDVPLTRYHQLRIASKRLRYTLEFFEPVLAPEAKTLIEQIKRLQDHLGNLQDAVVTCNVLRDFLMWGEWHSTSAVRKRKRAGALVVAPGVAAYLATRQAEIQQLIATFPEAWQPVLSPEFRQQLLALLLAWA